MGLNRIIWNHTWVRLISFGHIATKSPCRGTSNRWSFVRILAPLRGEEDMHDSTIQQITVTLGCGCGESTWSGRWIPELLYGRSLIPHV